MLLQENHFIHFKQAIHSYALPKAFPFPFYYQPHPLCMLAAKELQEHLATQTEWQHNFGIAGDQKTAIGKMFGVFLVQNVQGEIGYLCAFSGKLACTNHLPKFVPPVFDMLADDSFFLPAQAEINQINERIKHLQNNPKILKLEGLLKAAIETSALQIKAHRESMIADRKKRKVLRLAAKAEQNAGDFLQFNNQLSKQSVKQKIQLRDLNLYWGDRIQAAQDNLNQLTAEISALKNQRKNLSAALQQQIFAQYQFLNIKGNTKSLSDIFQATSQLTPPAGAGECAAPKLLHYAFNKQIRPLAMAEFWWGASPKSEIRKHLNFYHACLGKCQPILEHMLDGMKIDENPLLNSACTK